MDPEYANNCGYAHDETVEDINRRFEAEEDRDDYLFLAKFMAGLLGVVVFYTAVIVGATAIVVRLQ